MKQITNKPDKTVPPDVEEPEVKHDQVELSARMMDIPLLCFTQHEANFPTLFNEQRLEIV